jgi:hypothetical protein
MVIQLCKSEKGTLSFYHFFFSFLLFGFVHYILRFLSPFCYYYL